MTVVLSPSAADAATLPSASASLDSIGVRLALLDVSPCNVRSGVTRHNIAALAQSIAGIGLLTPLAVSRKGRRFRVEAGARRLAAIRELHDAGRWPADRAVPCVIVAAARGADVSLAENVQREPMHPADEFAAWKALVDSGESIDTVAARHGVTPAVVQRRLRLANLSPLLLRRFRAGEIELAQMMALAITTDHAEQERVWQDASHWHREPDQLRRALTQDAIASTDPKVRYIGLDTYIEAGGALTHDLFAKHDANDEAAAACYLQDRVLVERLAAAKVQPRVDAALAQGWRWARYCESIYEASGKLKRAPTSQRPLSGDEAARLHAIKERIREIDDTLEPIDDPTPGHDIDAVQANGPALSDDDEDEEERLRWESDALEREAEAIAALRNFHPPAMKSVSGVFVFIDRAGIEQVREGCIAPEDHAIAKVAIARCDKADLERARQGDDDGDADPEARSGVASFGVEATSANPEQACRSISDTLRLRLSAHRTAALQLAMSRNPIVALRAVVQKLVIQCGLLDRRAQDSMAASLQISVQGLPDLARNAPDLSGSKAATELAHERESWASRLTAHPVPLSVTIADLDEADLLALLAVVTAMTLNATEQRDIGVSDRPALQLAQALSLDMRQTWTASAESYFGHLSKALIIDSVREFAPDSVARLTRLRKAELVVEAEALAKGTGWLPTVLRL